MVSKQEPRVKVCFIDDIPLRTQNYLKNQISNFKDIELFFHENSEKETLVKHIADAHILVGWRPTREILDRAVNMKLFINPGAGIRHLLEMFRVLNEKRTVLLANGHGNAYFVAQHAVALLLTLMNKIILHHNWMRKGRWRTGDNEAASIPLRFRKVGLFGYGAINQKVHKMLAGFDIEFSILRNHWEKQVTDLITPAKKFDFSQLHAFLKEVDILIIAVPATSLTEGVIQQNELKLLGTNGLVVNVARGEIIDEKSL
ncbi:MAG: NAD(P)-dependent oxidoreductase, partial [Candidatus Hermodarchaeota archaeon]